MAEPQRSVPRRFSWVDAGAAAAVVLATAGVIWSPKLSGAVARATGGVKPVLVTVDVKHVPSVDPAGLLQQIQDDGRTSLVIRNQPHGSVKVEGAELLERRVALMGADGQVAVVPDPNNSSFSTFDARLQLQGEGRLTSGGVVLGNQALKIGSPVELEGPLYRVKGQVSAIRMEGN